MWAGGQWAYWKIDALPPADSTPFFMASATGDWTRSARADVGTRCTYLGDVDRECCYSSFVLRSTAACMHCKFRPECLCSTPRYIHCGAASVKHIQDQACAAPFGGLVPASLPVCVWCHSMALKCMRIRGGKIISKVRARLT